MTKIEAVESENRDLRANLLQATASSWSFTATNFAGHDELISLHTDLTSYKAFLSF